MQASIHSHLLSTDTCPSTPIIGHTMTASSPALPPGGGGGISSLSSHSLSPATRLQPVHVLAYTRTQKRKRPPLITVCVCKGFPVMKEWKEEGKRGGRRVYEVTWSERKEGAGRTNVDGKQRVRTFIYFP
ncbi:hypothetical protein Pmani_000258 [Petrolisthes manimaculis]|uniref:Uncharacterized protein n=1 Tax=Petrolisthes manimaculis TaxID=1843537 RepID=A0AAE1ULH2_9EUCA|nr:hypothetical protein Pmani_000258 [Petrolisthes manimaculis]